MWFQKQNDTNKNAINSSEYERLSVRLSEVVAGMSTVKTAVQLLETDVANLRGKFNRKLSGLQEEEKVAPKEEEKKKIESFNNDGFVCMG